MDTIKLLNKFHLVYVNRHRVEDKDGPILYMHPQLNELCRKAYARGEEYFYTTRDKDGGIVEGKPEYVYTLREPLTEEEYEFLKSSLNNLTTL